MNFSENVHFEMECKGMIIKELSQKTGISENTLKSYLKSNPVEPKATNSVKIARALGVSVEYLVTGGTEKTPQIPAERALSQKPSAPSPKTTKNPSSHS